MGAGFSIEAGVTTQVHLIEISHADPAATPGNQFLRTTITINGTVQEDAVVSQAVADRFLERLKSLEKSEQVFDERLRSCLLTIEHHGKVPERSGFGASGAAALSLAFALDQLFGRPLSMTECGQIAHLAEISCGTGLGTVIGEFVGGCEIRTVPGAPGIGRAAHFDPGDETTAIFLVFGALSTKSLLSDEGVRDRINTAGRRYLDELIEHPTVETFLRLSREFSESSGLISPTVRSALDLFDENDIPASMLMFGDGVFTVVRRAIVPKIRRLIDKRTHEGDLLISRIDSAGGRIIDED